MGVYLTDEQHQIAMSAVSMGAELQTQLQQLTQCGTDCTAQLERVAQYMDSLRNILYYFAAPHQRAGAAPTVSSQQQTPASGTTGEAAAR